MKIDLTEILREVGNEADVAEEVNLNLQQDGLRLMSPVQVNLHLINSGEQVLVEGTAEAEAEIECSRCLKKFNMQLAAEIDEEYSKSKPPAPKMGKVIELKEEDFVYPIEEDNTLDLDEMIRQNLLLAVPIKVLCSENCKGE